MDMAVLCISSDRHLVLPPFCRKRISIPLLTHFILLIILALADKSNAQGQQIELRYSVREEGPPGQEFGNVKVDSGIHGRFPDPATKSRLRFRFLSPPEVNIAIDEVSGILSVRDRVDRDDVCESMEECVIETHILVTSGDNYESTEIMKVNIVILDVNDNKPEFDKKQTTKHVLESASLGTSFSLPVATDKDSPKYGVKRYELLPADDHTFRLKVSPKLDNSVDLKLELQSHLNREEKDRYQYHILAYDGGSPAEAGGMDVFIVVEDTNDNPPRFLESSYSVDVRESAPVGSSILTVEAVDRDLGLNGEIMFALSEYTEEAYGDVFLVDRNSGTLGIRKALDHETRSSYILTVTAKDKGPDSILAECQVQVNVLDENDNAPDISVFMSFDDPTTSEARIPEDASIDTFVALISVVDRDSGDNGRVNCSLQGNHRRFRLVPLDANEYKVVTAQRLDRETDQKFAPELVCSDYGERPRTSSKRIQIIIEDINDNDPLFWSQNYVGSIIENNYPGKDILQVNASDADAGANARLHFWLPPDVTSKFIINETSGVISAATKLDYEQLKEETFRVFVRDGGTPPRSSTATVKVTIENINDSPPVFSESIYNFDILENKDIGSLVGQVFAQDADDEDEKSLFTFSLESKKPLYLSRFSIDPHSGEIRTKEKLDREEQSIYLLTVIVSDAQAPRTYFSEATLNIHVRDENDNTPMWIYPLPTDNTIRESNKVPIDHVIATLSAKDSDYNGGGKGLEYSITKGNEQGYFRVDQTKGTVMVAMSLEEISFEFFELYVEVQDNGKPPLTNSTQLNIYINHSIAYAVASPEAPFCAGTNCIIVLSLTCSCVLLSAILCTVILIIRRKERSKKQHKYNCRMEALLKMQDSKEPCLPGHGSPVRSPSFPKTVLSSGDETGSDCSDKQQRAYMAVDSGDSDMTSQFRYHDNKNSRQMSSPPDRYVTKPCRSIGDIATTTTGNLHHPQPPLRANDPHVEVHHFLDTLPEHHHSNDVHTNGVYSNGVHSNNDHKEEDSVHSGDGSNTDSGRGASEEGEHRRYGGGGCGGHTPNDYSMPPRPPASALRQPGTLPRLMTSSSSSSSPHSATMPSTAQARPQVTFNLPPQQTHFHTFGPPKPPLRASTHNQNGGGAAAGTYNTSVTSSPYLPPFSAAHNGEVNGRVHTPSPPSVVDSINMTTPQRQYNTQSLSRNTQPPSSSYNSNNSPQYRYINTNARDTTI